MSQQPRTAHKIVTRRNRNPPPVNVYIHGAAGPHSFLGVRSTPPDGWELYDTPRLTLPQPR